MTFSLDRPEWRVMGVDPGTDTLGFSILDLDRKGNVCVVRHASTLHGSGGYLRHGTLTKEQGELAARLTYLEGSLFETMRDWKVDAVISEKPFLGRNPKTFTSLLSATRLVEAAAARHNPFIKVVYVTPGEAKVAVGSPKNSKDKSLVEEGVKTTKQIVFNDEHLPERLDEHAFDSIAVGWARMKKQLILEDS